MRPAGEWIGELVEMELAWCRHLDLTATVVAQEMHDDELSRGELWIGDVAAFLTETGVL